MCQDGANAVYSSIDWMAVAVSHTLVNQAHNWFSVSAVVVCLLVTVCVLKSFVSLVYV